MFLVRRDALCKCKFNVCHAYSKKGHKNVQGFKVFAVESYHQYCFFIGVAVKDTGKANPGQAVDREGPTFSFYKVGPVSWTEASCTTENRTELAGRRGNSSRSVSDEKPRKIL